MRWLVLLFGALIVSCASKTPLQNYADLQATPASPWNKISFNPDTAKALRIDHSQSSMLEAKDGVVQVGAQKTYYKVFHLPSSPRDLFFELRSLPYKPAGFGGQFGLIDPEVVFFDEKGRRLFPQPENIAREFSSSFVDGKFLRAVWKIRPHMKAAYAVVTARTDRIGQNALSVTQYGAASVGVIFDEAVQFSPTGYFHLLTSESFKK